ncbi:glycosylated lysosomal membrane protein [Solea solea]|uniref:glycosylated lysosomal membrane protein n=1 Tax=Solea solea TaxID=90069 RepID=UPI00272B6BA7|nr:glycosylated lysosomal membrane protein [Solea solea]
MAAVTVKTRRTFLVIFLFFSLFSSSGQSSFTRQLTVQLNPGWSAPAPPGGDLLHIRAVGDNDTLHFLFCSQGAPTLLLVHTNSSSSSVKVDWTLFLARNTTGSLRVEPESSVLSSTALVFSRLLEYDDINDTASMTSDLFPPYELQNLGWSRVNSSDPFAPLCGSVVNSSGSICLQLSAFESEGRDQSWPRLLHTANSSQLGVWLDGVSPRAARSRFMLELQAVGGAYPLSRVDVHQSIDDEFTPSIFKASHWVSSANGSSEVVGFVRWRSVAFRRSKPALEDATPCRNSAPRPQSSEAAAAASGLIRAFYSNIETFGLNVSFGLAGEPFYNSTRLLSWTLLVGVGSPPVDSFSALVVAIMAVGLGAPVLVLLVGGVWICTRKRAMEQTAAYEPIN